MICSAKRGPNIMLPCLQHFNRGFEAVGASPEARRWPAVPHVMNVYEREYSDKYGLRAYFQNNESIFFCHGLTM